MGNVNLVFGIVDKKNIPNHLRDFFFIIDDEHSERPGFIIEYMGHIA